MERRCWAFVHPDLSAPGVDAVYLIPPEHVAEPTELVAPFLGTRFRTLLGKLACIPPKLVNFVEVTYPPACGLHAALPPDLADAAIAAGWAEPHPMARRGFIPNHIVMLYGPRDTSELAIIIDLVRASRDYACGRTPAR